MQRLPFPRFWQSSWFWFILAIIGMIGWQLDAARILDPVGLVSPISPDYMARRSGNELVTRPLVDDLRPDYIIVCDGFSQNLLKDSTFRNDYQIIWREGGSTVCIPGVGAVAK